MNIETKQTGRIEKYSAMPNNRSFQAFVEQVKHMTPAEKRQAKLEQERRAALYLGAKTPLELAKARYNSIR